MWSGKNPVYDPDFNQRYDPGGEGPDWMVGVQEAVGVFGNHERIASDTEEDKAVLSDLSDILMNLWEEQ